MSALNYGITIPDYLISGTNSQPAPVTPAPATTYHPAYDQCTFLYMLLNSLHNQSYDGELENINYWLDNKKLAVRISYLGARELVSSVDDDEYKVPIAIDTVARRVINATDNKNGEAVDINNEKFKNEAMKTRNEIFKKLKNYYAISDDQLKKCSFIVRIFNSVREIFNSSFFVRQTVDRSSSMGQIFIRNGNGSGNPFSGL